MRKILVFFGIFFITFSSAFTDLSNTQTNILDMVFYKVAKILDTMDTKGQMQMIEVVTTKLKDDMWEYDESPTGITTNKYDMQDYLYGLFKEKYIRLAATLEGKDLEKFLYKYYTSGVMNNMTMYYNSMNGVDILDEIMRAGNVTRDNIINVINLIRDDYSLPRLKFNERIAYSTLVHSEYLHANDTSGLSAHNEVKGKSNFYGVDANDRMKNAGFDSYGYFEVISWDYNRLESLKNLISIPYHRIPFISSKYDVVGFPFDTGKDDYGVMTFGRTTSQINASDDMEDIIVFPKNNGILYDYIGEKIREVPYPFTGYEDIVGKVISIGVTNSNTGVLKNSIRLKDMTDNKELKIVLADDRTEGWHHFIAIEPLKRNRKYEISFIFVDNDTNQIPKKSYFYTGNID